MMAASTFKNVGLKATEHISKIVVDPRDSKTVYVAAQGPLWSSGGERGLYKTTDGGKTWKAILTKGPWTGVTDIAIDPRDPDILYAATHQRHRTVWGVDRWWPRIRHLQVDRCGRASWTELTNGLPGSDKGKMAIAISPQQSGRPLRGDRVGRPQGRCMAFSGCRCQLDEDE